MDEKKFCDCPGPRYPTAFGRRSFIQVGLLGGMGLTLPELFRLKAAGGDVRLANGGTARANESYIRESILTPNAKLVNGYGPIMPTFQGVVNEEQVVQLMAYVKSLSAQPAAAPVAAPAQGTTK